MFVGDRTTASTSLAGAVAVVHPCNLCPIHTANAKATKLSSFIVLGSVNRMSESATSASWSTTTAASLRRQEMPQSMPRVSCSNKLVAVLSGVHTQSLRCDQATSRRRRSRNTRFTSAAHIIDSQRAYTRNGSLIGSDSKVNEVQGSLAVASIARDDPSPLPGMHRDHNVR